MHENLFMQFSHRTGPDHAAYAYFDSTEEKVSYIEQTVEVAQSKRRYLSLFSTESNTEPDVIFARNKTKIIVGLSSLAKTTQFKQGPDVTALLSYGDNDKLSYMFCLQETAPTVEELCLVQKLSSRPENFNQVILDSLKEEQSYGWSMNQAMLSTGVFTYVEDLVAYQGNKEYKSWMFHFHVAA